MDVGGIPYGVDYRNHIYSVFEDANVLVAVIGPEWLGLQAGGIKRIDERVDPVRVEIQTALTEDIFVLPVLVEDAKMPAAADLPDAIQPLAFRNALRVESGADFSFHIERLITSLDEVLGMERGSGGASAKSAAGVTGQLRVAKTQSKKSKGIFFSPRLRPSRLLPYFLVTIVSFLLAHYLIVMKLDLDPLYLRLVAIVVPAACGFLLFRSMRLGIGPATVVGLIVSLIAVAGMTTIVGLVDGHSILPSGSAEWQEAFEYVATITLAAATGNVLARLADGMLTGRSETL
jgi:hypothetical protein